MLCPFCHVDNDKVIDSRASEDGMAIRRRRQCMRCEKRYTTYERIEELSVKVIKKDKAREPYRREKIRKGVSVACWKRPISDEQIERLIGRVEHRIFQEYDYEIPSRELGNLVMAELRQLDQVAYVRFASVYREFDDARDFVKEIQPMLGRGTQRRE